MVRCYIMNPVLITELIEYLAYKLRTIIMDSPPRDTKSMNDIVFDKFDHVGSFNFNNGTTSAHFEK